jgi:hypothetical protein
MYIAKTSMVPLWQKIIGSRIGGVADELCCAHVKTLKVIAEVCQHFVKPSSILTSETRISSYLRFRYDHDQAVSVDTFDPGSLVRLLQQLQHDFLSMISGLCLSDHPDRVV